MNIMALGAIGELVGGIAVIGSLVYVGLQIRQNTSAIRANSAQGFADSINAVQLQVSGGGAPTRAWQRFLEEPGSLTTNEYIVLDMMALSVFQTYDSGLLQAKLGSLDADTRDMIYRRIGVWFEYDYFKDWWTRNPWEFGEPLMGYVEREFDLRSRTLRGNQAAAKT